MLILGQNGDVMVNVERIHAITTHQFSNYEYGKEIGKRFSILAWYGIGEDDYWGIGDYATEDRAKEVLRQIYCKYGGCVHRQEEAVDVTEEFRAFRKVFEIPKE